MIPGPPAGTGSAPRRAALHSTRRAPAGCALVVLCLVASPAGLAGQGVRASRLGGFRLELGAAATTPIVEDGNGVSVRSSVGVIGAGDATLTIDARTAFVGSLRGSTAPLRLRSMDRRWSAGWAQQLDLALRLERAVTSSIAVGGGMAASLLRGPDDVIPYRGGGGTLYGWGPELTLAAKIPGTRHLHAVLGADAVRINPRDRDARIAGGWIGRLRLGLRYAP